VLLRQAALDGIRDGSIRFVFRRWERPSTVKPGGTLKTRVGVVAIDAVDAITERKITTADALAAGYPSRAALLTDLRSQREGTIFRIAVRYVGDDPRVALRADAELSDTDADALAARFARWDRASPRGPWTRVALEMIRDRPATLAADLAASIGWETQPFKTNIRKLKELGLTESLPVGYRLSPRGEALLARLTR